MKIFNNFVTINTEEDVRILGGCTMNKLALGLTTTALTAIFNALFKFWIYYIIN